MGENLNGIRAPPSWRSTPTPTRVTRFLHTLLGPHGYSSFVALACPPMMATSGPAWQGLYIFSLKRRTRLKTQSLDLLESAWSCKIPDVWNSCLSLTRDKWKFPHLRPNTNCIIAIWGRCGLPAARVKKDWAGFVNNMYNVSQQWPATENANIKSDHANECFMARERRGGPEHRITGKLQQVWLP